MLFVANGDHLHVNFRYNWVRNEEDYTVTRSVECRIYTPDNHLVLGEATCSKSDKYVKSKGRKLAFTRAVNHFHQKETRAQLWGEYHRKIKK